MCHFPYIYFKQTIYCGQHILCLFFVYMATKQKKVLDHDGRESGFSRISRLAREACEKDALHLPLVLQQAQIKSSLKGRENIISIAFSSAT